MFRCLQKQPGSCLVWGWVLGLMRKELTPPEEELFLLVLLVAQPGLFASPVGQ